jgi:hypothetical protein
MMDSKRLMDGTKRGILLAMVLATAMGTASAQSVFHSTLVPTARTVLTLWKYTTDDPGTDWQTTAFADDAWQSGAGGFGSRITPAATVGTDWTSPDIWLRKVVTLPDPATLDGLGLIVHHDEAVEIYVNGTLVLQDTGYSRDYYPAALDLEARGVFKAGDNLIAVHCHQTTGGQFIDVGVEAVFAGSPTTLFSDARSDGQTWKYSIEEPGTSNWINYGFDDAGWNTGVAGFGTLDTPGALVATEWSTSNIWMRKSFTVGNEPFTHFFLTIHHDEDVMVAINGRTVLNMVGYSQDYQEIDISEPAKAVIVPGDNVIAVYVHQTGGGQFIDVGLKGVVPEAPVGLRAGKAKRTPVLRAVAGKSGPVLLFFGLGSSGLRSFGLGTSGLETAADRMFDVRGKRAPILSARP